MILPGITYWSIMMTVSSITLCGKEGNGPENFFTPRRFPGEPPWLRTEPPARLVAVRMEPVVGRYDQVDVTRVQVG
jgi:hypothetical protein